MGYEEKILTVLIDRYERRDPAKIKKICFPLTTKFPEYREPLSRVQSSIEQAVQHLLSWGFVECDQNLQGYYTKITLTEVAVPQIYDFLHRMPKADLVQAQRTLLKKTMACTEGVAHKFCTGMLERLEHRKEIEYGLARDLTLLNDVLLTLAYLERLNEETYIRNFSEMVFHNSKRLQNILNPITKILMDYGDGVCQKEMVLAQYNLISNPSYVYIKGSWKLWCQGQCVSVELFQGGIAISSNALNGIERIAVPAKTVISVENLTTYHDTKQSQGAIIYLGGFLNTVRTNFLKQLYLHEPNAQYFHKGDLDPYGFLILENLKEKTKVPFRPLEMDLDTLRRCHQAGHFRPLSDADRRVMDLSALAEYKPVLQYMAEYNCKIEQECFEAMKLEQLVGSQETGD